MKTMKVEANASVEQTTALNHLRRQIDEDARWRFAMSHLAVNQPIDLSPSVWTSQNLAPLMISCAPLIIIFF